MNLNLRILFSRFTFVRYLVSGGTAAAVNIGCALFLYHVVHIQYLYASSIGFLMGFLVSFMLQKYWTFQNKTHTLLKLQFMYFSLLTFINLGLTIVLVYLLTDKLHLYYGLSQIFTTAIVALWSFFIYGRVIFK
jgi:putative flippase GtrA